MPKVTVDFWLIKLMAVTVGETAADYLAVNLGLGLMATSLIMTGVLVVALVLQFAQKRYVPWAYWLAVVLISIVGTLVTDNLTDNFGVALETSTICVHRCARGHVRRLVCLSKERCRSTRSSRPGARCSTGWRSCSLSRSAPLPATCSPRQFDLGYLTTGLMFGGLIAVIAFAYYCSASTASWRSGSPTSSRGRSEPRSATCCRSRPNMAGSASARSSPASCSSALIAAIVVYMTVTRDGEEEMAEAEAEGRKSRAPAGLRADRPLNPSTWRPETSA